MNVLQTKPEAVTTPLIELREVRKSFPRDGGPALEVLGGIDFTLVSGEIVGMLGRSGSGKSTLLRIVAGLLPLSDGEAHYSGEPIVGPPDGVALVFQSFGLFPWLTVLQNVQLGLEALGLPADEQRRRAVDAIDLIGLDGFEQAYPRELSGGMQQRVGLARALVVHPKVLLMDEPFSALDVLTAESLRTELLELWQAGRLPIEAMVLVTHSIEEAVLMCDRVVVFGSGPGRVVADVAITLPRPRHRDSPEFALLVDHLYGQLTDAAARPARTVLPAEPLPVGAALHNVAPGLLTGLVEVLAGRPYRGRADLPQLADEVHLGVRELFPVAEALQQLGLAELSGGDLHLTDAGAGFAAAAGDARKQLFAQLLLDRLEHFRYVTDAIRARPDERLPAERFEELLASHLEPSAVEETLQTVITWGRYAELFSYDDRHGHFTFENP